MENKIISFMVDQNGRPVKNDTRDGKSQDELHKRQHPHLEMVKVLEKTIPPIVVRLPKKRRFKVLTAIGR